MCVIENTSDNICLEVGICVMWSLHIIIIIIIIMIKVKLVQHV